MTEEKKICEGIILPIFDERNLEYWERAVLYFVGLLYSFLGVTVIMDVFMTAVEAISSKTKRLYDLRPDLPEYMQRRVWNPTVANLTLMAVGSSTPEIFMSVIEVIGNKFEAGTLGPGVIVGSGAVNLLSVAFCIMVLKAGETRRIFNYSVFLVTGVCHLLAYVWLYLVLSLISPGVVQIWEAGVMLLSFPLLIFLAYAASKHFFTQSFPILSHHLRGDEAPKEFAELALLRASGSLNNENIIHFVKELMKYPGMTLQDAAVLCAAKMAETDRSSMWYRIGGARVLTSGKPVTRRIKARLKQIQQLLAEEELEVGGQQPPLPPRQSAAWESLYVKSQVWDGCRVEFESPLIAVTESHVEFPVYIQRYGDLENRVAVRVQSVDGMAVHGEDYVPVNEVIFFEPGQERAQLKIRIIDEKKYEPTEEFFLRLSPVPQDVNVKIGRIHIMEIKIIQVSSPGVIEFEKSGTVVGENEVEVVVNVLRKRGSDGVVSVHWTTSQLTALSGVDYLHSEGKLLFREGEVKKSISISLINTLSEEKDVFFEIILSNPEGGALIGHINKMKVIITDDGAFDMDNFIYMTNINVDKLKVFQSTWCQQIKEAMLPNGGEIGSATNMDYFLHLFFFLWKLVFALIPPPTILNGWISFSLSIVCVGVMATLIGDMAAIFGCSVGLHNTFTAMTIVAIGTSLTDAFACRFALIHSKYADNAIGNINGTGAVNVYLGFGLPWTMAAIYHASHGNDFYVPAGDLEGVVVGYLIAYSLALFLLFLRRKLKFFGKAEIGGPHLGRIISCLFLVIIWIVYITVSYLIFMHYIKF